MNNTIEETLLAKAQTHALGVIFSATGDLPYEAVLEALLDDSLPDDYTVAEMYEDVWHELKVDIIKGFVKRFYAAMLEAYSLNHASSSAVEALQKVSDLKVIQKALRSYEAGRFCDTDLRDAGLLVQAALAKAGVA